MAVCRAATGGLGQIEFCGFSMHKTGFSRHSSLILNILIRNWPSMSGDTVDHSVMQLPIDSIDGYLLDPTHMS